VYLGEIAARLTQRLRELGREHWVLEDCAALADVRLYEPDPSQAWARLRGLAQLPAAARARAKLIAMWRERLARERDLPRGWLLPDAAIFEAAQANPATLSALRALHSIPANLHESIARGLLDALHAASGAQLEDQEPGQDSRPTPEQKVIMDRLAKIVDARAAALEVSPEILVPRGEIKALAMGKRDSHALTGWRLQQIGTQLLEDIDRA
jgi:ribonuclease D